MHRHHRNHMIQKPWSGIQSGVWMIGLAILFFTGLWWPGILILMGVSMVLQWAFSSEAAPAFEAEKAPVSQRPMAPVKPAPAPVSPLVFTPAAMYHPVQALPSVCTHCG